MKEVKNYIFNQARFFLQEANEFYPFGVYQNLSDEIVPIGVFLNDDHPSSQEVLSSLINIGNDLLDSGKATIVGFGVDVLADNPNTGIKCDAIEARIYQVGQEPVIIKWPYNIEKGAVDVNEKISF